MWIFINIGTGIIIMISMFLKKEEIKRLKALKKYNMNEQREIEKIEKIEQPVSDESFTSPKRIQSENSSRKTSKLIENINESLYRQFKESGYHSEKLKSDTDFIVGYIIGFCDGYLSHHSINNNTAEGFSVPSLSLINIYG